MPSANSAGFDSDSPQIRAIWEKAHAIRGLDPDESRLDDFGMEIRLAAYGDRESDYGWEADRLYPCPLGAADAPSNFRPVHWRIALRKRTPRDA